MPKQRRKALSKTKACLSAGSSSAPNEEVLMQFLLHQEWLELAAVKRWMLGNLGIRENPALLVGDRGWAVG